MSGPISTREKDEVVARLGGDLANPARGERHAQMALAFVQRHGPGSTLSNEQMDRFLGEWIPDYQPSKRGKWVGRLRQAGTHIRMEKFGQPTFTVYSNYAGTWYVTGCGQAISGGLVVAEFERYGRGKREKLAQLAEGVSLSHLKPGDRRYMELELKVQSRMFKAALRMAEEAVTEIVSIHDQLQEQQALPEAAETGKEEQ